MLETVNISTRTCKMSQQRLEASFYERSVANTIDKKIIMMPLKLICQRHTALSQDMLNANKQCNIIQEKKELESDVFFFPIVFFI